MHGFCLNLIHMVVASQGKSLQSLSNHNFSYHPECSVAAYLTAKTHSHCYAVLYKQERQRGVDSQNRKDCMATNE